MIEQIEKFWSYINNEVWATTIFGILLSGLISLVILTCKYFYSLLSNLFSKDLKVAKLYKGEFFLYHTNLIDIEGSTITASKIKINSTWNAALKIKQINLKDNSTFFKGKIEVDSQCIYCIMDGVNDTDHKLIIFQKFYTAKQLMLYNAVGTMTGITTDRNPYSTLVLITKKELPINALKLFFAHSKAVIATKTERDKLVSLYKSHKTVFDEKVDVDTYISSLG